MLPTVEASTFSQNAEEVFLLVRDAIFKLGFVGQNGAYQLVRAPLAADKIVVGFDRGATERGDSGEQWKTTWTFRYLDGGTVADGLETVTGCVKPRDPEFSDRSEQFARALAKIAGWGIEPPPGREP